MRMKIAAVAAAMLVAGACGGEGTTGGYVKCGLVASEPECNGYRPFLAPELDDGGYGRCVWSAERSVCQLASCARPTVDCGGVQPQLPNDCMSYGTAAECTAQEVFQAPDGTRLQCAWTDTEGVLTHCFVRACTHRLATCD